MIINIDNFINSLKSDFDINYHLDYWGLEKFNLARPFIYILMYNKKNVIKLLNRYCKDKLNQDQINTLIPLTL